MIRDGLYAALWVVILVAAYLAVREINLVWSFAFGR